MKSHVTKMLFEHFFHNTVPVLKETADFGISDPGEIQISVFSEKAEEINLHGVCHFIRVLVELFVD